MAKNLGISDRSVYECDELHTYVDTVPMPFTANSGVIFFVFHVNLDKFRQTISLEETLHAVIVQVLFQLFHCAEQHITDDTLKNPILETRSC
jgi:hypothetical protein